MCTPAHLPVVLCKNIEELLLKNPCTAHLLKQEILQIIKLLYLCKRSSVDIARQVSNYILVLIIVRLNPCKL